MRFFKINFWRSVWKFLHKRGRFAQLEKDIEKTQEKFDEADRDHNETNLILAGKRDDRLRRIKMKTLRPKRGV